METLLFYFISSSSQPDFTAESPGLISSMSSLPINASAYFFLVVVSSTLLEQLSPSSWDICAATSDEHSVLISLLLAVHDFIALYLLEILILDLTLSWVFSYLLQGGRSFSALQ